MVEIIEYEEKYFEEFKTINLEWLEKYHLTEESDLEVLNDPQKKILDGGGCIYLAKAGDVIIGSAALIKTHDNIYELAKMAVVPAFHGKGIGKILLERCLEKAKEMKAEKLILYSNSQLKAALIMYEKYGFRHIPVIDSPFVTADVKMELSL